MGTAYALDQKQGGLETRPYACLDSVLPRKDGIQAIII